LPTYGAFLEWDNVTLERENRDEAVKARDFVASKMTSAEIAEAQKLAREWKLQSQR
jgi:hypothetical protein